MVTGRVTRETYHEKQEAAFFIAAWWRRRRERESQHQVQDLIREADDKLVFRREEGEPCQYAR